MFLTSIPRIARLLLAFVVLLLVLAVAAVGTLFYVLDEKAVKSTIDAYAKEALNAQVEYAGPVSLKHLTSLQVHIPALRFTDLATGSLIGSIEGAEADVAMWSALLGAVNVNSIRIDGAKLSLRVPSLSGDTLYDETFGAVRFPANLRVSEFRLNNARIDLTTGQNETKRAWTVNNLALATGRLSPEMTTPFEFSAHFEAADAGKSVPAALPAPVVEPSLPQTTPEAAQPAPAPDETPTPKDEAAAASPATPAPSAQTAADAPADPAPAPAHAPDYVDTPANPQPPAGTQPSEPTMALTPLEAKPDTPAPETDKAPAVLPEGGTSASASHLFSQAWAQSNLPASVMPFVNVDPTTLSGDLSAKGKLAISVTDRFVMLESVGISGEINQQGQAWTAVAKADRLRFKGSELSGSNLTASLSQPADTTGDIHVGAVDFRVRPGVLESPEMRFSRTEERGGRVATFEAASSVRADFVKQKADLDNLTARVSISGDPQLPTDFNASVSGYIKADLTSQGAQVGLSGNFAGAPISFNGAVRNAEALPELEGELMIGAVNRDTLPGAEMLAWMQHFNFSGAVRIGNITAGGISGTQLNGILSIQNGRAVIDSLVINTAEGRLFGTFELAQDTSWLFNGRIDGVSLDKFIIPVAGASPVSGIANGDLTLSGQRFDPASLSGTAKLRVLRPAYIGLDAAAVRNHLVTNADTALITREGARTDLDEASLAVTLTGNRLTLQNIVARSVYVRGKADAAVDLTSGELQGTASLIFAPQQGVPSIHLAAALSGTGKAPAWSFEWEKSAQALARAQGKPILEDKDEGKSIWQSVKDFFRF